MQKMFGFSDNYAQHQPKIVFLDFLKQILSQLEIQEFELHGVPR